MSFHPRTVFLIYSSSLDNFIYWVLLHKSCICTLLTLLTNIYDDPTIKPYYLWEFSFPVPRSSFIGTQTYAIWSYWGIGSSRLASVLSEVPLLLAPVNKVILFLLHTFLRPLVDFSSWRRFRVFCSRADSPDWSHM